MHKLRFCSARGASAVELGIAVVLFCAVSGVAIDGAGMLLARQTALKAANEVVRMLATKRDFTYRLDQPSWKDEATALFAAKLGNNSLASFSLNLSSAKPVMQPIAGTDVNSVKIDVQGTYRPQFMRLFGLREVKLNFSVQNLYEFSVLPVDVTMPDGSGGETVVTYDQSDPPPQDVSQKKGLVSKPISTTLSFGLNLPPHLLWPTAAPVSPENEWLDPTPPPGGGGCFVAGTKILMADGTRRPIESISKGDRVLSADSSLNIVPGLVNHIFVHPDTAGFLIIETSDGTALRVTKNHAVFSSGSYIQLRHLKVGSPMMLAIPNLPGRVAFHGSAVLKTLQLPVQPYAMMPGAGMPDLGFSGLLAGLKLSSPAVQQGPYRLKETAISRIREVSEAVTVYNFEVDDTHTYFAGEYLVHNRLKFME